MRANACSLGIEFTEITEDHHQLRIPDGSLVRVTLIYEKVWCAKQKHRDDQLITSSLYASSATATSIIRLIYLMSLDLNSVDVTWTIRKIQIWTPIEMNMVIISGKLLALAFLDVYIHLSLLTHWCDCSLSPLSTPGLLLSPKYLPFESRKSMKNNNRYFPSRTCEALYDNLFATPFNFTFIRPLSVYSLQFQLFNIWLES